MFYRTYARSRSLVAIIGVTIMALTLLAPISSVGALERPMLRLGSSGDAVLVLEQRLTELGYRLDTTDTEFKADTRTAVLAIQKAANIGQDGIVGPITWAALDAGTRTPQPEPTPTPTPAPTPTPDPDPTPDPTDPTDRPTLRQGSTGQAVLTLELRLAELGYWIDDVDSTFGYGTHNAVVALQKVANIHRDGVVGPNTWAVVDAGTRPPARVTSGRVIEVDLTRQLLLVVDDGVVEEVHNTSTGRGPGTTPVGTWTIGRQIDGFRYAPLGVLYRPKYFYRGVAIHGFTSVPSVPASHGCVRLTYPAMDHIWASGAAPLNSTVVVYS